MDPMWLIVLRVTERIVIYAGAIFMIYLGYSLYKRGISKGRNNLQAKTKLGQIILPGTGPGLFFMAFGAIVLLVGLFIGRGRIESGKIVVLDPNIFDFSSLQMLKDPYYKSREFSQSYVEVMNKKSDILSEQEDEPNNTAHEDQAKANQSAPNDPNSTPEIIDKVIPAAGDTFNEN